MALAARHFARKGRERVAKAHDQVIRTAVVKGEGRSRREAVRQKQECVNTSQHVWNSKPPLTVTHDERLFL